MNQREKIEYQPWENIIPQGDIQIKAKPHNKK